MLEASPWPPGVAPRADWWDACLREGNPMNACIRRAWLLRLRGRARPGGTVDRELGVVAVMSGPLAVTAQFSKLADTNRRVEIRKAEP